MKESYNRIALNKLKELIVPETVDITEALCALETPQWIRLLRADGINVEEKMPDASEVTMISNRYHRELKKYYNVFFKQLKDFVCRGMVFEFVDGSQEFFLETWRWYPDKQYLRFDSRSPEIVKVLENHMYLSQVDGDRNKVMETIIIKLVLDERKLN